MMPRIAVILVAVAGLAVAWVLTRADPQTRPSTQPTTWESDMKYQTATFAAGCFWGVQSTFEKLPGVIHTRVGYTGGKMATPSYEDVCTDLTGHAEALEIEFDPQVVSYQQLLNVFFENHDPTTMNRQGPDVGTQYRSAIFYHSPDQKGEAEAEKARREASGDYVAPIVTQILPAGPFYAAEDYHQFYFDKHGVDWTCHNGNGKKPAAAAK
jgi:peptide-methionine (S)-S-oxide reductase